MEEAAGYRKLIVWQKSDELAAKIYKITSNFPKTEQFCLTSQLRRAALSVPTNIVEGYARNSKTEFRRFLMISLGSLAEVKYLLMFAKGQKYLSDESLDQVANLAGECGQLLWRLSKSVLPK